MTFDVTALSPAAALAGNVLLRLILPSLGIMLAWALLRVARRVSAAVQCWIWWIACLELLVALAPLPGFRVQTPRLPSILRFEQPASPSPAGGEPVSLTPADPARGSDLPADSASPPPSAVREDHRSLPELPRLADAVPSILLVIWALGLLCGMLGLLIQGIQAARLVAGSRAWRPWSDGLDLPALCRRLGLTRVPDVLVSPRVRVPQIVGTVRPRVIVPERLFDALEPAEKEMALCHELAHIRRVDLFWGWIPCLAVKVLWFHPLARLAAHEYQIAREAACDLLVLDVTREAPRSYGRLLLRFSRPAHGIVVADPAGAALSARSLKRRLLLVAERDRSPRRALAVSMVMVVLIGFLPFRLTPEVGAASCPRRSTVAREIRADRRPATAHRGLTGRSPAVGGRPALRLARVEARIADAMPALDAPIAAAMAPAIDARMAAAMLRAIDAQMAVAMAPALDAHVAAAMAPAIDARIAAAMAPALDAHMAGAMANMADSLRRDVARMAAMADRLPAALPITPELLALMGAADRERAGSRERRAAGRGDGTESLLPTFVFVRKDGENLSMMGEVNDAESTLERIRRIPADEAIWFHYQDRFYIIVDRPTIEKARRLFDSVERIGNQQSELGRQQAAVGEEQGRIGQRQGALGEEQARIGQLQAEIMKEMADRREDRQSAGDLERRLEELSAELQVLSGEMESLGEVMDRLGQMQDKLGGMQAELGDLHEQESSKLRARLIPFVQEAIERGVAQPAE